MSGRAMQGGRTLHASCRVSRFEPGDGLQQPAAHALAQPWWRERAGRERIHRRGTPATSTAAGPSPNCPRPALLAAPCPATPDVATGTTKRKLCSVGVVRALTIM